MLFDDAVAPSQLTADGSQETVPGTFVVAPPLPDAWAHAAADAQFPPRSPAANAGAPGGADAQLPPWSPSANAGALGGLWQRYDGRRGSSPGSSSAHVASPIDGGLVQSSPGI